VFSVLLLLELVGLRFLGSVEYLKNHILNRNEHAWALPRDQHHIVYGHNRSLETASENDVNSHQSVHSVTDLLFRGCARYAVTSL